ncbi:SLC13 family permease [Wohlfahrtiimonas chitiniclastica]|uniref:SLC13 family permease n=1 Tax=Wohlfahrtiimonas chitiniclastica TaxID=400946 RepID=UPI00037D69DE|nr:SLC13 family permease [Wohlfahrtiimonas chitiniclastica]
MNSTVIIFLLVYTVMALGKFPGLKLDRTGAALVGALAMLVMGAISGQEAWNAISYPSLGLLFGLMVVSGAFGVSGFYRFAAERVATLKVSPPKLLAILIVVSGVLSSVLTNDVVVVAMTPLLIAVTLSRGLNPVPFVLAFCFAANTGSAGTLIGSPQNMIIAQQLELSFTGLLKVAGVPAVLSLLIVWAAIVLIYRNRWDLPPFYRKSHDTSPNVAVLNTVETIKASIVTVAVIIAFMLNIWPQAIVALAGAAVLLMNRKISSQDVLKEVDYSLLILIMSLFVVNAAMAKTGLPQALLGDLKAIGLNLNDPLSLFFSSAVLSNIVGNNPAVMLLAPYVHVGSNADVLGAALVLGTGFSSNLIVFGSLAGIIAVEESAKYGIMISFKEFAKAGVPVACICLAMAAAWIVLLTFIH